MQRKTEKHLDHTKEEIEEYLQNFKKCISSNRYNIETNQKIEENRNFLLEYRINSRIAKKMLLSLKVEDFCYSVDNYKNPEERLYVFCKDFLLSNWGDLKRVFVYIKIFIVNDYENDYSLVISFHEPIKKISWLFKEGE